MSVVERFKTTRSAISDRFRRNLRSLRISVVDLCNLRCRYCMPEDDYSWLPQRDLLTNQEIVHLVELFSSLGVDRIRITGGEPLLRGDLTELVASLSENRSIRDIALTTNATRLAQYAEGLHAAGLHRITVSLDTLESDKMKFMTGRQVMAKTREGLETAASIGFGSLKINTVVIRGFNDDELCELFLYAKSLGAEIRFIEYMDVGGATHWSMEQVVDRNEILKILTNRFGEINASDIEGSAPAETFTLQDGTRFGIISSVSSPFCSTCDRSRITADGIWFLCLYAASGFDLRSKLRQQENLSDFIKDVWQNRDDRGAEKRSQQVQRSVLYDVTDLRRDHHREMHKRGG